MSVEDEMDLEELYGDDDPTSEEDLWFVAPPPDEDGFDLISSLTPATKGEASLSLDSWGKAQEDSAVPLAHCAQLLGELDATLNCLTSEPKTVEAYRRRILLKDLEVLAWQMAPKLGIRRMALSLANAEAASHDEQEAFFRVDLAWCVRKLSKYSTIQIGDADELSRFLGWTAGSDQDAIRRDLEGLGLDVPLGGEDRRDRLSEFIEFQRQAEQLHPIVGAAAVLGAWRIMAFDHELVNVQGYCLAALHGGKAARNSAVLSLPMLGTSMRPFTPAFEPGSTLPAFLAGVEEALLRALMEIQSIGVWRGRAVRNAGQRQGKVMAAVIDALTANRIVSSRTIMAGTSFSVRGVGEALRKLEELGLVREITGGSRYRFWTSAMDGR